MKQQKQDTKYFLYARKSSESEDRQMASIDAQINELNAIAKQYNLNVVQVFSESRSAKAPGRPIFNDMLARIHKGEANGILCWKLNRLARNPVDGGNISWMLQQGVLHHIQTYGRSYYPNDNVIVMAVELGMANQFVRDLSVDTKRGLKAKAERGWYPTFATLGYMHNPMKRKGEKEIVEDSERFSLVRKMFDLMLTGQYAPPRILKIATDEWGLRNRVGNKIARSTAYRIFSDPFYYGEFEYPKGSGNWHKGEHEPMISREEFDTIQMLLGRGQTTRPKSYDFPYRGPLVCGECGAMITAERKVKRQKNGVVRFYTYYHCTKRKNPDCSQGVIEEKELEQQIADILGSIEIPTEFHDWAMNVLKDQNKKEAKDRESIMTTQRRAYDKIVQKLDNLIDLRAGGEITEEDFSRRKNALTHEKTYFEELLKDSHNQVDRWLETVDSYFAFAEKAHTAFSNGSLEVKKGILATLGSNLTLKDKKLNVSLPEPLLFTQKVSVEVKAIHEQVRTAKNGSDKKELARLYAESPMLLRG